MTYEWLTNGSRAHCRNREGVAKNADEIAMLKKISKELDDKSVADEKRTDDLNVRVENLHMNVTLQHRTVMGCVEDRKCRATFFLTPSDRYRQGVD